eukprot:TRINITY_DN38540_c0_g1_i1.p1 TRINITY_DN38540_c0_g1~~TRINITY_DN38540_c0_g1_i1.p1  ORF type:complete len:509 (-),score=67.34 TRINITY_DN38540_c0_g1_i1:124-1650(-)
MLRQRRPFQVIDQGDSAPTTATHLFPSSLAPIGSFVVQPEGVTMMAGGSEADKSEQVVHALMKLPSNKLCMNCKSPCPQYVCCSFNTFVCTTCSGIHREFSHRIKSPSWSTFTWEEAVALQNGGNEVAATQLLASWDPKRHPVPESRNAKRLRDFIREVYLERRFAGDRLPALDDAAASDAAVPRSLLSTLRFSGLPREESQSSAWTETTPVDFSNSGAVTGTSSALVLSSPISHILRNDIPMSEILGKDVPMSEIFSRDRRKRASSGLSPKPAEEGTGQRSSGNAAPMHTPSLKASSNSTNSAHSLAAFAEVSNRTGEILSNSGAAERPLGQTPSGNGNLSGAPSANDEQPHGASNAGASGADMIDFSSESEASTSETFQHVQVTTAIPASPLFPQPSERVDGGCSTSGPAEAIPSALSRRQTASDAVLDSTSEPTGGSGLFGSAAAVHGRMKTPHVSTEGNGFTHTGNGGAREEGEHAGQVAWCNFESTAFEPSQPASLQDVKQAI